MFNVTDKSKEFSVHTPDNHLKSMNKYSKKDEELTEKELAKTESELNGHKVMLGWFPEGRRGLGNQGRVKSAIITMSGSI